MTFKLRAAAMFAACFLAVPSANAQLFSSIAPEARTGVASGNPVTFFATAINSGNADLNNCRPDPESFPGANFSYQTVDGGNQLTGTPDTPVTIAAGQSQGFLLAYTPPAAGWEGFVSARIVCDERDSEFLPYLSATLVVPASGSMPDIVAISATPSGDGVIRMNRAGGRGVMAVAAVNIGNAGDVVVRPLDAQYMQGLATFTVCETDAQAQCLAEPAEQLTVNFGANQVRTFAVFAQGQDDAGIPFYPDILRVRLQLTDSGSGYTVGSTSVAFTAPDVANAATNAGVYSVFFQEPVATRGGSAERFDTGILGILPDGHFYFWGDGNVFGGGHGEWVSHGFRPVDNQRLDSPNSFIQFDSTGDLAIVDWVSGITAETGIAGRYQPSSIQLGDPYGTVQQRGRYRGAWLGEVNRRATTAADAQGLWYIRSGNSIVGQFEISEAGEISNGEFFVPGFTNCAFSGDLTQQDAALNIFAIQLRFNGFFTGCGQPFNGATFDGFATMNTTTEGPIPSGGSIVSVLTRSGNNPAGFSFLFVKA
jgi:hypothetical protein